MEGAGHSYAALGGRYMPLTRYRIREEEGLFEGELEIPLSVGTVGGSIKSNPQLKNTYQIMGYPTAAELGHVMVSVGLANNFAALRALSIQGI